MDVKILYMRTTGQVVTDSTVYDDHNDTYYYSFLERAFLLGFVINAFANDGQIDYLTGSMSAREIRYFFQKETGIQNLSDSDFRDIDEMVSCKPS